MNKADEKVMTSIRNREPLCEPFLKVSKILEVGEMGNYLSLCNDRICEAELIDGEDVRIDFLNFPDLELTAAGVWVCRKILNGYVSEDIVADAYEVLQEEKAAREHINIVSQMLREMKLWELVQMFVKSDARIRRFVVTELCQRFILVKGFRKMRSTYYDILVQVKYHGLLSVCGKIAADVVENNGK